MEVPSGTVLWWDEPQELATLKAQRESEVAQKAYPYQSEV